MGNDDINLILEKDSNLNSAVYGLESLLKGYDEEQYKEQYRKFLVHLKDSFNSTIRDSKAILNIIDRNPEIAGILNRERYRLVKLLDKCKANKRLLVDNKRTGSDKIFNFFFWIIFHKLTEYSIGMTRQIDFIVGLLKKYNYCDYSIIDNQESLWNRIKQKRLRLMKMDFPPL